MAKIRVRKNDPFRCLVTEVLPAETPIIFSNDGFYLQCLKHANEVNPSSPVFDALVRQDAAFEKRRYVPYSYRVKKSALSHRVLSVVHVGAQWQVARFYNEMSALMLHYTRRGAFTIRAPKDVAKTYFIRSAVSDMGRFKKSPVSAHGYDKFLKHSPSYFAYSGFSRLYKFFDSTEFLDLEKEYSHLWMIDVTRCFDSIYTHSISWAVKEKHFSKANTTGVPFFGDTFDAVMQSMNFGETSGIVIGPEFSRIFAEIILQRIDANVSASLLTRHGYKSGVDYSIRRYVDDCFVFSHSDLVAEHVYHAISEELRFYKLTVNESKLKKYKRPFLTEKSKTIIEISKALNRFVVSMSHEVLVDERIHLVPKEIKRVDRLVLSFCNEVKLCCSNNGCEYDEVSSYLISALKNRAVKIMDSFGVHESDERIFGEALSAFLQVALFLYSVAPSVTASYKLCAMVVMVVRFSERKLPLWAATIKQLVFDRASEVLNRRTPSGDSGDFVDLESQNLLLAISDLGSDYRLSSESLNGIFKVGEKATLSYFNLVTLLYYVKDDREYALAKRWALELADHSLKIFSDIHENAEKAMIFLDLLSCPYVDRQRRLGWLSAFFAAKNIAPNDPLEAVLDDVSSPWWFINWKEIDLLNMLERRELHAVY
jgi:Reverse transcriptase (RNA-dependent DNA polymerase)